MLIALYANYFFLWPIAGCFHLQKTSETAQVSKCVYATNGGYFGSTGACVGNLITDSKVIQVCVAMATVPTATVCVAMWLTDTCQWIGKL